MSSSSNIADMAMALAGMVRSAESGKKSGDGGVGTGSWSSGDGTVGRSRLGRLSCGGGGVDASSPAAAAAVADGDAPPPVPEPDARTTAKQSTIQM